MDLLEMTAGNRVIVSTCAVGGTGATQRRAK
jgi:hypothetical protein